MKYTVTIEETVSEEFTVEASSPEEARRIVENAYKNEEIVLEPGNCIGVKFTVQEHTESI